MISSLKKMRGDKSGWYKVSDLVAGLEIARPRADFDGSVESSARSGDIVWDEIMSITPVGREQVYDIEVEGTHNFVGNGIFAHNTYVLRANTALAVEGQIYAGGVIVPVPEVASASATLSSAIVAEIPSSVLTADGLGVDLYKLATYNLASGQELAEKVNAHETRLVSLETRLALLESGAISLASGSPSFASSTEQLASWLAAASNGIGDLFAKAFHASEKICVDNQCLTKDDVKNLLVLVHTQTASVPDGTTAPATMASTTDSGLPTGQAGTTASTTPTTSGGDTTSPAVSDVTPPVVTLVGDAALQITVGDAFTDPGATALDDVDGDLTAGIVVTGAVDTALAGLYELAYSATDAAGNTGSVSRVVTVVAPSAPVDTPPAESGIDSNAVAP